MQYLDQRSSNWQSSQLTKYSLLVVACLLLWFIPFTHNFCVSLDEKAFALLNGSLEYSHLWRLLWGYLNHPAESWLNVIFLLAINILGIFSLNPEKRQTALAGVVYFWLFFQVVLFVSHFIFRDVLAMQRLSPSLVLTPKVILSEVLNIPTLKVASDNCFPAGHALVAIYWAKFSSAYAKVWVQKIIIIATILLILPRLFSGAHWLSDIVFTIFYALICYEIAINTKLFLFATRNIQRLIAKVGSAT